MFASFNKHSITAQDPWASIAGIAAFLRRIIPTFARPSSMGGALEHLGSLPLTAHSSLALVRLNKEMLLLGITPQGITLLTKGREETASARKIHSRKNIARAGRRMGEESMGK